MVQSFFFFFNSKRWRRELFHCSKSGRSLRKTMRLVQTVAVDSGATSNKGRGGNWKLASWISLPAVPWERSKKATGRHSFHWKKGSQGGRTSQGFTLVYKVLKKARPPLTGKEPRRKEWGKDRKEWEKKKKTGKEWEAAEKMGCWLIIQKICTPQNASHRLLTLPSSLT